MYVTILFVTPAAEPAFFTAPLFTERFPAGFPSAAADYTDDELDPNAYSIRRHSATYFFTRHRRFDEGDGPALRRFNGRRQG